MVKSTKSRRIVAIILALLMLVGMMPMDTLTYVSFADEVESLEQTETETDKELPKLDKEITIKNNSGKWEGKSIDALTIEGKEKGDKVTCILIEGEGKDKKEKVLDNIPEIDRPNGEGITLKLKIEREGYQIYESQEYTVKVTEGEINWITVDAFNGTYNKNNATAKEAVTVQGVKDGDHVTYTYMKDNTETTTNVVPTIETPGELEVTVTVKHDKYKDYTKTVKAKMALGNMEGINISPIHIVYDGEEHEVVNKKDITGLEEGDEISYSTDGTNYDTAIPKIKNAGELPFYVRIHRKHHNDYITSPALTAVVEKAEISDDDIKIDYYKNSIYEYAENGHQAVESVESKIANDKFQYASCELTDKETLESVKSKLSDDQFSDEIKSVKVSNAGRYAIFVKVIRNNNYKEKIIDKELVIEKSEQEVSFKDSTPSEVIYNTIEGKNIIKCQAVSNKSDADKKITYSIVSDDAKTTAGASIDENTGEITYTTVGKVTVKAYIAESGNYTEASCEKEINIKYADFKEFDIDISTCESTPQYLELKEGGEGKEVKWYSGKYEENVVDERYVFTAPTGYSVAEITSEDDFKIDTENPDTKECISKYVSEIVKSEAKKYDDFKVSFRDTEGNTTGMIPIKPFAIDSTKPQIETYRFDKENTNPILNMLTFGLVGNDTVKVRIYFSDAQTSAGVKSITVHSYNQGLTNPPYHSVTTYKKENDKENYKVDITDDKEYLEYSIPLGFEGTISAEIEDNVGNKSEEVWAKKSNSNYEKSEEIINLLLENNDPKVNVRDITCTKDPSVNKVVIKEGEGEDEKRIYNGNVQFEVEVDDAGAIQSGLKEVNIKINGDNYNGNVFVGENSYDKYFPHNYYEIKDKDGKVVEYKRDHNKYSYTISTEGINPDEDGKYVVDVIAEDNAGNITHPEPTIVYKDTTYPIITGFKFEPENNMDVGKDGNLYKVVETTDYGFYFKKPVTVTISAEDYKQDNECAAGVATITYKAVDINGKTVVEGKDVAGNKKGTVEFEIPENFKGQIYAYATDKVDNSPLNSVSKKPVESKDYPLIQEKEFKGFAHPNGSVVETITKHTETSSISFSVPKAQGEQNSKYAYHYTGSAQKDQKMDYNAAANVPLYSTDKTFKVTVADTYSGIRNVKYTIIEGDKQTVSKVEVENSGKINSASDANGWNIEEKDSNLVTKMSKNIKVSGNHNDMVLLVELTDRAGNKSYDYYAFGIDKTAPTIDVTYDNNNVDSSKYFKANRTATIVINERNFRKEDVKVAVTKNEKKQNVSLNWKTVKGKGNKDDTKHIAKIKYSKDGDYAFNISYKDNVGNSNKKVNYANQAAPKKFTIDKTSPTISVTYDNNSAKNGKYFNAYRTATVVVKEHNFDAGRVKFKQTASLDGKGTSIPNARWSGSGDIHTAKIAFHSDGDYTFDVTMNDKAGNVSKGINFGNSIAAKDFTIDTKIDKPTIAGVKNGTSYKGKVIPKITLNDVNYDRNEIKLTRTRMGEKDVDVTKEFIKAIGKNGHGGTSVSDTFKKKAEVDGIYTLSAKMTDKAGNESSEKLKFTVNRFGSVYELSTYTYDINNEYIQKVNEDLVITEYNADKLVKDSLNVQLTKDGTLVKDVKYSVNPVADKKVKKGDSGWYQYEYKIDTSNFEKDGIYKLVISSKDEAGNKPETINYKDSEITFRVDTTAPEITSIVGLEKAIVNAESQDVKFEIFDSIGLKSVKVYVDGKAVKSIDTFADGANCKDAIRLTEGANQNVRLVVEDLAGNVSDTDSENFEPKYEFHNDITISTNFFVRWYANKLAFWGTIIGFIVVVGGIIFFIFYKRRKEEEK